MNIWDIVASTTVMVCIAFAFKFKWLWLLYGGACLIIAVVDYQMGLMGQTVMNMIVFCIAIKNYFRKEVK